MHLAHYMQRTEGTIKTKLMAIRYHHLLEGIEDPLKGKGRVWLALAGIKRRQASPNRKLPVDLPDAHLAPLEVRLRLT